MNNKILSKLMWQAHFRNKAGTNSYLLDSFIDIDSVPAGNARKEAVRERVEAQLAQGFQFLLPIRLSLLLGSGSTSPKVAKSGRGTLESVGQMKAEFTQAEISPNKRHKDKKGAYRVVTSIWACEGCKTLFWGTLGISLAEGRAPEDNGDLVIFRTADWKDVDIYIFRGLAKPNDNATLPEVVEFVKGLAW